MNARWKLLLFAALLTLVALACILPLSTSPTPIVFPSPDLTMTALVASPTSPQLPTATALAKTSAPTTMPSDTPIPPTEMPASPTPAPPEITVDTVAGLANFSSFGQGEVLRSLAFSPAGTTLASVAGNNEDFAIRLWEVESEQPLRTLQGHTSIVWGVAFSPDSQMLASASSDGTAKVWDWRSGSLLESLNFPNQVVSVTFSPDSQTLAVGGVDEWPMPRSGSGRSPPGSP